jgi:DNA invertase Pin-like site-specific DNA recombinase
MGNITIALYIRTSTKEQTPELQLKDINSILPVDCEYHLYKEQESAYKDNVKRIAFEELIKQVKAGQIEHIYVWDLDRLYRNLVRLKEFFLLCKLKGVKVHSFNQKWLDELHTIPAPFNEIMFDLLINLFGWLGEDESKKKSARIRMAVKTNAKGQTISYKGNKWGRKGVTPQCITKVLELRNKGNSIRQIADQVFIYDKNNNPRKISIGCVHKILTENSGENSGEKRSI